MREIDILNQNGEIVGGFLLDPNIWQVPLLRPLISLTYRGYFSNQHQNTHKTKNKSEVEKTTKKSRRQKGTGMARQGPRSNPHFVGGGVAHGPRGEKSLPLHLNKKAKKKALQSLLGEKLRQKEIVVLDKIIFVNYKTKEAEKLLSNLPAPRTRSLIILGKNEPEKEKLIRAFRNLPYLEITDSQMLNVFTTIIPRNLIFTHSALSEIEQRLI
ncbi:31985_t:CDS:1 [Racocetra persica]|uniref:31985_t:CDS:1 n=1 Tax=Racocetra persica TaxID=160502 RepID=A0ACA9QC64_9GLOM|nr:31985_t:CDS:1 [Racocetra persica]